MRKQIAAIFLVSSMLLPVVGNAQGVNRNYGNDPFSNTKVFLGVKYGLVEVDPDVSGADTFDLDNMGFNFGGHFNDYLALEFEYSTTVSADKQSFAGSDVKVEADSVTLFLVARTAGDVYGRARLGYSRIDQDVSTIGSDTVYGLAYGIGGGFEFADNVAVEFDYTVYPETDEFDRLGKIIDSTLSTEVISIGVVWSYE